MQAVIPHPYDQKRPTGRTADAQTVGLDDHTPCGLYSTSVSHMIQYLKDITNWHDCQADKWHHFQGQNSANFVYPTK